MELSKLFLNFGLTSVLLRKVSSISGIATRVDFCFSDYFETI